MKTQCEVATVYDIQTMEYTRIPQSELIPGMIRVLEDTTAQFIWIDMSALERMDSVDHR